MTTETLPNAMQGTAYDWKLFPARTAFECAIETIPEDDGSFSAIALSLPGAGSCGDTEAEAIDNARDAILGVIQTHIENGEEIPWVDREELEISDIAKVRWIMINA